MSIPKSTSSPAITVGPQLVFEIDEQPSGDPPPPAGAPLDLSNNPSFGLTDLAKDGKRLDDQGGWQQVLLGVDFRDTTGADLPERVDVVVVDANNQMNYTPHPPLSAPVASPILANLARFTHLAPNLYFCSNGDATREFKRISAVTSGVNKLATTTRLRNSMFCAPHNLANPSYLHKPGGKINTQNIVGADGILDDIILLSTICNQGSKTPGTLEKVSSTGLNPQFLVDFDPLILNLNPQKHVVGFNIENSDPQVFATQQRFYNDLITSCHANHLQILAGYNLASSATRRAQAFNAWIAALAANPSRINELDDLADDIVGFLNTSFPGPTHPVFKVPTTRFDGICFDIEIIGSDIAAGNTGNKLTEIDARGEVMSQFYRAVASRMALQDKYVAVANGALVAPHVWGPSPSSTNNLALAASIAQPYKMALGMPNLVLQPQCYDSGLDDIPRGKNDATSKLWDWHHRVIDYALGTVGLHPSQLQLSIKIHKGQKGGEVTDPKRLEARCAHLLRPNRVGVARFAMGPEKGSVDTSKTPPTIAAANFDFTPIAAQNLALNPDPNRAGSALPTHTIGQPSHVPLTDRQASALATGQDP